MTTIPTTATPMANSSSAECLDVHAKVSDPLAIKQITVRTGRLVCDIAIDDPAYRTTNAALAALIAKRFPDVPYHACVNGCGRTFSAVMERTPVPHMLEHMAISLQTRLTSRDDAAFEGTTVWTDEKAGKARIELGFCDDLEALRAFTEATAILNDAVLACLP